MIILESKIKSEYYQISPFSVGDVVWIKGDVYKYRIMEVFPLRKVVRVRDLILLTAKERSVGFEDLIMEEKSEKA